MTEAALRDKPLEATTAFLLGLPFLVSVLYCLGCLPQPPPSPRRAGPVKLELADSTTPPSTRRRPCVSPRTGPSAGVVSSTPYKWAAMVDALFARSRELRLGPSTVRRAVVLLHSLPGGWESSSLHVGGYPLDIWISLFIASKVEDPDQMNANEVINQMGEDDSDSDVELEIEDVIQAEADFLDRVGWRVAEPLFELALAQAVTELNADSGQILAAAYLCDLAVHDQGLLETQGAAKLAWAAVVAAQGYIGCTSSLAEHLLKMHQRRRKPFLGELTSCHEIHAGVRVPATRRSTRLSGSGPRSHV
jgi:hypothetical protein